MTIRQRYFLQSLCHCGVSSNVYINFILFELRYPNRINHYVPLSLLLPYEIHYPLATTFLELWRRKQALIVWEWDLQNVESDEENRPEFETSAKNFRTNPVTKEKEPYIPTWTKVFRYFVTASVVTMMVSGTE